MKNLPTNLSKLKTKVDKLNVGKLVPVPPDVSKLNDAAKDDVIKENVYNAKIKNMEEKIADITNLAITATLNAKVNEVKNKIPNITNSATTIPLLLSKIYLMLII